jgi:hypothetical protein
LVDVRDAVREAQAGMPIYGQRVGSRVMVLSQKLGALGFAPTGASRKMIEAATSQEMELIGAIISISKTKPDAEVRLCLS